MLARIMGSGSSSSSSGISSHQLLAPPSPLPSTHPTPHQHQIISTTQQKLSSAIFYGTASFLIIFLNKLILGSNKQGFYGFPSFSFLAVTQFMTTSACLWGCKKAGKVQITELNVDVLRIMSPLVLISLANVISGLGGTQKINLPMFTVLRRFSIFLTMVLEGYVFGTATSSSVKISVFMMIFGALVAAMSDLTFDAMGYTMIFFNDLFTALNGVMMRKSLVNSPITKMAVLYYNSVFGAIIMLMILACKPQEIAAIRDFDQWQNPMFLASFCLAASMGSMLQYAIFICTYHNSALTTTVIGCLKNVLTTYMGMLFLSDYVFSLKNFVGVNVSILGSILYIYTVTNKSKGNDNIKMMKGGGRGGGGVGTTKATAAGKKQGYWG